MAKRKKSPSLEDLVPDAELRKKIQEGLVSGKPISGEGGIFTELLQSIVDACLDGEMSVHLDKEKSDTVSNRRNGKGKKVVKSEYGDLSLNPPRDRNGTFSPKIVEKRSRALGGGFDNVVLALYAQGNSNQDIQRLLKQMYGIDYSSSGISIITEQVWPRILEWQQRPLKGCYPIIYLDGMHFRVKEDGQFHDKMVYSVLGVDIEGQRDILGLYIDGAESSSNWSIVLDKVHKVRNSVRFVSDKERKRMCSDLRKIYTSANRSEAMIALEVFEKKWPKRGPKIAEKWRADWDELMVFMDFSEHIRRMIYTTNPIEALHRIIRRIVKSKGAWVSERALRKQLFLSLQQNEKSWKRKAFHWLVIQQELEDKFGERFTRWLDK